MNFQVLIESNMKLFLCYVQNYEKHNLSKNSELKVVCIK